MLVTVADGEVVAALRLPGSLPDPLPGPDHFPTIDDLFDLLRTYAENDPDRFEVTYDGDYGFPVRVEIDVAEGAIDDEYAVEVRAFAPSEAFD